MTVACELRGLDETALDRLQTAGRAANVAVSGAESAFVAGSVRSMETLIEQLEDDQLTAALTAVVDGSR